MGHIDNAVYDRNFFFSDSTKKNYGAGLFAG
jgi:hypothetical protein